LQNAEHALFKVADGESAKLNHVVCNFAKLHTLLEFFFFYFFFSYIVQIVSLLCKFVGEEADADVKKEVMQSEGGGIAR